MLRAVSLLLLALLLCIPSFHSSAAGDEEEVLFPDDSTVSTPSRRPQPISESPSPVTVISRDDIRRSGARTLPEVLALAPGVDTVRLSEANVEVSIRGFNGYGADKVLVMLDSRPLFNLADASVNWNLVPVPVSEIERVEIVRGPGSALYGENAFFGTINIITRSGSGNRALVSGGSAGSGTWESGGSVSLSGLLVCFQRQELRRFGDLDSEVENDYLEGIGREPIGAEVRVSRAFMNWAPRVEGGSFRVSGGYAWVETDYSVLRSEDQLATAALETSAEAGDLVLEFGLRGLWQAQEVDRDPFPGGGPYRSFSRIDAEVRGIYNPTVKDVIVLGLTYSHRRVADDVYLDQVDNEITQQALSVYLENQLALLDKRLFVTAGVRADMYEHTRGVVSPRTGMIFILSPRHSVKLGWGQAFRAPTLYDLFAEDRLFPPWVFEGDPDLKPESVSSWNLNYLYQRPGRMTLSIDLFHHDVRDLIIYRLERLTLTERVYKLINEDRAYSWGGEFEIKIWLSERFDLFANYSYAVSDYDLDGDWVEAPFSPRHKANAGMGYSGEGWRFYLWGRFVGEQVGVAIDSPYQQRIELNDWASLSTRLELWPTKDLAISVTWSDMLSDGHYEAPAYAPVTPYVFGELTWSPEWGP